MTRKNRRAHRRKVWPFKWIGGPYTFYAVPWTFRYGPWKKARVNR